MFLDLPRINIIKTKQDLVNALNNSGKFWEFQNKATEDISDEYLIEKALIFLEFEDLDQIFDIFGYEKCKKVFSKMNNNKSNYNNIILELLEILFFYE